jgi:hypothetical protein
LALGCRVVAYALQGGAEFVSMVVTTKLQDSQMA